jgi:hypothetical protein
MTDFSTILGDPKLSGSAKGDVCASMRGKRKPKVHKQAIARGAFRHHERKRSGIT